MTTSNDYEHAAAVWRQTGDHDAVLQHLRDKGFSKLESIKAVREFCGVSLGEAKRIATASEVWKDTLADSEELHDAILEILAEEERPGGAESLDVKTPTKTKRRWFRFSLRTFLIALTISCVWLGWYVYRAEQQREAVKWVRENGGAVYYDYEYNNRKFAFNRQPSAPKWLVNLLGVDYFSTTALVNLSDSQVSDVTPLAGLTNLEHLRLTRTQVSDEEFKTLKQALPNCSIGF